MKVPVELGNDIISVGEVRDFNVLFTFNSIQVLVELVQHPVEKFLRIMLCISLEHRISFANGLLEPRGCKAIALLLVP